MIRDLVFISQDLRGRAGRDQRAWKPDSAPQAMVMNRNGNRVAGAGQPLAMPASSVMAGTLTSSGLAMRMPMTRRISADFQEGGQIVARGEEQTLQQCGTNASHAARNDRAVTCLRSV